MASSSSLFRSSCTTITSSAPVVALTVPSRSSKGECQLIKGSSVNERFVPTAKLCFLDSPDALSTAKTRMRSLVWAGHSVQRRKWPCFGAVLVRNESLIGDEASSGSSGVEGEKERQLGVGICPCRVCGRRGLIASVGGLFASTGNSPAASGSTYETSDYNAIREAVHPARFSWYEKLYAKILAMTAGSYDKKVEDYKRQLFRNLDEKVEHILEVGIGTGPNLKYYANLPRLQRVVGVDPNRQMAKYCADSATAAGLSDSQFEFLLAVGEGIPVRDESMDAVLCTLTLCTVLDVMKTLQEIKRVLKPGGAFLFIEHVAAPEGSVLRFWQGLLEPIQVLVADNCHLTRNTLQYIDGAQFDSVQSSRFNVSSLNLFSPHVMGIARK